MIPNQFHFVFGLKPTPQPFHLVHYLCLASCIGVNAPEAVYFYYHHEPYGRYWNLIREQVIPVRIPRVSFVDEFQYSNPHTAKNRYAHASDRVRLDKVVRYGGVYADIDTLFVNPIPDALWSKPFVLGREDSTWDVAHGQLVPSVCNAFIMSERGASFGKLWQQEFGPSFDGTWTKHSTQLPNRLAAQHPDLVHIEPSRTFYKHMWTRQGIHTLLQGLDIDYDGMVSMHLWAHMWWSRMERDFSSFHAADLTEDYVRTKYTTYSVAARRFLPPPETRSFAVRGRTKLQENKVLGSVHKVGIKAYILAKLAALSIVKENVFPRAGEHPDHAKWQWEHLYVWTRFSPRNRFEEQRILADAALWDRYGVKQVKFRPEDVVLDIGAHVGIFSYMCHARGSRAIFAFEPDVENFERLADQVGDLEGIEPANLAVIRSDLEDSLSHSGYAGENTDGGIVMPTGKLVESEQQMLSYTQVPPRAVQVIALDEILAEVGRVAFMKLACEGGEFPILLTSRLLERVDCIVGEYHELTEAVFAELDPQARIEGYTEYRVQDLVVCLERAGFQVTVDARASYTGLFIANRQL